MTEQEKAMAETSMTGFGRAYFGICIFGGLAWTISAFSSESPAGGVGIGVGLILSGGLAHYGVQLLVGMSHSLRSILAAQEKKS